MIEDEGEEYDKYVHGDADPLRPERLDKIKSLEATIQDLKEALRRATELVRDEGLACRNCNQPHRWEDCPEDDDWDPSPVNSWEVTEGVSASERDEMAWRQKEELDR